MREWNAFVALAFTVLYMVIELLCFMPFTCLRGSTLVTLKEVVLFAHVTSVSQALAFI
jgi:hypothetical protein